MASTNRETVKVLCKSIITRLENQKAIEFAPRLREIVQDEVFKLVGKFIYTDEDLKVKTLEKIGAKENEMDDEEISQSTQFRTARSIVRKTFGDDELNGMYFQKSLKEIAQLINDYLMRSSHIDDVYETDDDLEKMIVEIVRKFNPANLH